jgi:mycoredoxin
MNTDVVLYTRPGCPYCYRLRRGLRRRRVPFGEVNIRHNSVAAAVVRTHANGTETVPTVRVGGRWLVNPTAATVSAAAANRRAVPASATSPVTGASADTQLPPQNPGPAGGHGAAWLPAFRDWITPPRRRLLWPFGIRYAVLLQDRTRRRASRQK